MHRRTFLALAAAAPALAYAPPALAGNAPVFAENGIAIRGADPVAYFEGAGPVAGSVTEHVRWRGAVWLFASRENRETFERDPRRFAPRFGGYCAYSLSQGRLEPSDPRAYTLRKGRLYLVSSFKARRTWLDNLDQNIRRAEVHWPSVLG